MSNSITSIVLCPFYKWGKRNGEEKEPRALHLIIEGAQIHLLKPPSVFSVTPVLLFCTRLLFLHILLENKLLCIYLDQNLGWGSLSVSEIKRPFKFNCCLSSIYSCFSPSHRFYMFCFLCQLLCVFFYYEPWFTCFLSQGWLNPLCD